MKPVFPDNSYQLPAYRKAVEIFRISRSLASYFGEGKHILEMDISAKPVERYSGFLVTQSLQLAPGVASVLSAKNSTGKMKKIRSIRKLAKNLRQQCTKLEIMGVREIEFLDLLRKEINLFEDMISEWLNNTKGSSQ